MDISKVKAGGYIKLWLPQNDYVVSALEKLRLTGEDYTALEVVGHVFLEKLASELYVKKGMLWDMVTPEQIDLLNDWISAEMSSVVKPEVQDNSEKKRIDTLRKLVRAMARVYLQTLNDDNYKKTMVYNRR